MTSGARRADPETSVGARLSIGALSRATGIPVETLRTWESRYGFPVPERKPSGHRVYPLSAVPRLRRIAEALAQGHRAGQVVAAPEEALDDLLESSSPADRPLQPAPASSVESGRDLLRLVETFDAERLTRVLLGEYARLGTLGFLERCVGPLLIAIGEAWAERRLEVRHEHFAAERIGDLLRSLRLPLEERAKGPLVVCSSLPGEAHGLGLQMAALVLAGAGARVLFLGTEVPLPQMASLARDLSARAVAISVSAATHGSATTAQIKRLREMLPRGVTLLVGGSGAPRPRPGVEAIPDLRQLDSWAQRLVTHSAAARRPA